VKNPAAPGVCECARNRNKENVLGIPRYRYFDHDADVGIVGYGLTLEEAFEAAAAAMFALMTDLREVRPERSLRVDFEEADVELALVRWLNILLATAREQGMALSEFRIERDGVLWRGVATGESWRNGLQSGVEVKGATLTMLRVRQSAARWEAGCVVDV